jgi:peptide/nickel transport system substrate-binding protein
MEVKMMKKKILWMVVSGLMALSLVVASCGTATVEEEEEEEEGGGVVVEEEEEEEEQEEVVQEDTGPKYGGTLNLALTGDITSFDAISSAFFVGTTIRHSNEGLVQGDWTKGPAGGYGTNQVDWGMGYDVLSLKTGILADSWEWSADFENDEATLIYQIKQGVHYGLNEQSEASRLVNGREMTADDVAYSLSMQVTNPSCYMYRAVPGLRTAEITKTGPWEVTVKTTPDYLMTAFQRFNYFAVIVPPEVIEKYGDLSDWKNSVGTGPFMLIDHVAGSTVEFKKNPNYHLTDPIGPGKGNQLPYIDGFRFLILPDKSTRHAAVWAGKIDQIYRITWEDAEQFRLSAPDMMEDESPIYGGASIAMRVDMAPTDNIKVRRALIMATDLESIRQGLNGGLGEIHTWPWPATKGYEPTFVPLDDPRMPESVKDMYTYNPEKAKQLLAEAGYPDGFKIEALMTSTEVDYYSILKDMWTEINVDLEFIVRERGAKTQLLASAQHPNLVQSGVPQARMYYYLSNALSTNPTSNPCMANDSFVNEKILDIGRLVITDEKAAMSVWGDELMPYYLEQAYQIPRPTAPTYCFWWPWLKNYSGEIMTGESLGHELLWNKYTWLDTSIKKTMGY